MQIKKHFKLYKSGKQWVTAAVVAATLATGMLLGNGAVYADTQSNTSAVAGNTALTVNTANSSSTSTATSAEPAQPNTATSAANVVNDITAASEAVASSSAASSNQSVQSSAATNSAATTAVSTYQVAAQNNTKNGWVKENNHWTYYTNGQVQNGRNYSYMPTINGSGHNWYLMDNGVAQSGVQQWAGTYYYFDPVSYLRVNNNYVQSQWGDWYLFGNDGRILSGVQQWAGTYYYFDPTTYLRVDNDYRQSQWGLWYMFGHDGRIVTKVYQWAGSYYYFDPTTYLKVTNAYVQSQWGDWYLFGNDGRILSGVQQWAGSYYYFDPTTYLKVTNAYVQSQWGDWYMFGNDGRIVTGLKEWYGNYYYFDPTTYLKVTNKWVDGKYYDNNGIQLRNQTTVINGVTYNFDQNGVARVVTTSVDDKTTGVMAALFVNSNWFKSTIKNNKMYYGIANTQDYNKDVEGYSFITPMGDPTSYIYYKKDGNNVTIKQWQPGEDGIVADGYFKTTKVTLSQLENKYYTSQAQKSKVQSYVNKLQLFADASK